MSSRRCGYLFGALLLAAVPMLGAREMAPPGPDAPPVMPPADKKIDPGTLPAGWQIVLTPAGLQVQLDKAHLEARAKLSPTECRLQNGEVKGGFVHFEADFVFHADQAHAVFALACGQAKVTAAKQQDGRTPMLSGDAGGYFVQVEQPGDYTTTLYLSVPLSQRPGGGRGLELDLPRAVVTSIDLALPPDSRAVRINGKDVADTSLTLKEHRPDNPPGPANRLLLSEQLGIIDKLDLSWQGPPPAGAQSLRTARGRVTVRVEGGATTTEAELVLHAQGEPAAEWTVIAPQGFDVKAPVGDQRIKSATRADDPAGVAWTVVLKAPSTDDLTLTATPAPGQRPKIGPFLVRGASRQFGVVLVSAAGPDAHPVLRPHADLNLRDPTEVESKADPTLYRVYDYAAAPTQPWLEVETSAASGWVKTHSEYALSLGAGGPAGGLEWQVKTTFRLTSSGGNPVDRLDVELPAGCEYLSPTPPDPSITQDANMRVLHVALNGAAAASTFSISARYVSTDRLPPRAQGRHFPLPRLSPVPMREMQDGGAQIDATVPPDFELLSAEPEAQDPHRVSLHFAKTPEEAVFSWQPYTPAVIVSSVIDLTFHGRRADVEHELHLHFPRTIPTQVILKTPPPLGASLKVVGTGGALTDDPAGGGGTRILKLLGSGPDQVVTLHYSLPVTGPSMAVPLATVDQPKDQAPGDERMHVRVWCDPGRLPQPPGGDWSERDIEKAPNKPRLPVLVLGAARPDAPLTLTFRDAPGASSVLVDRVLYRASLEGAAWEIHVSYLLRQPADANLEVELPDAPSVIHLHAKLDDAEADPEAMEETGPDGQTRHLARFRLSGDLFLKPAVLDLTYSVPQRGGFVNTLTPPRLVGDPGQAPTRWRITLPADCVALAPEGGPAVRWTVGLRGPLRLPAPQLAVTNDELEQWFAGADADRRADAVPLAGAPSLVGWQDAGQPLTVVFLPEWAWMVLCSVPLALLGLLLFALVRRSYGGSRAAAVFFWLLVLPLAPAVGAAWVFRPTILYAVAFGCEPGAAVLLLFLLAQAVMLERYRRRIVFLPNFRRARSGSSLVRANGAARPAGEPSTVDAPRPGGSSQQPG